MNYFWKYLSEVCDVKFLAKVGMHSPKLSTNFVESISIDLLGAYNVALYIKNKGLLSAVVLFNNVNLDTYCNLYNLDKPTLFITKNINTTKYRYCNISNNIDDVAKAVGLVKNNIGSVVINIGALNVL